jgi:ubiquitin carboxyl-terminal hydrolase 48
MQDSFKQCATISGQTELHNLIPSIYWGKSSIETSCSECNYTSTRIEDFKCLPIPIIDCEVESRNSRPKGISNDVDVQQLLYRSLHPESLDGDNQYLCSGCNKKCDAMRCPKFEHLPPVLTLQLNRYVFDRETLSKQKLTTKVLLPHTLYVPLKGDETKTYVLVAVQNHLGNSAHGGHYVANVLDWSTGVWFELNDEDVDVLADGPRAGFHPVKSNNANGEDKRHRINGSADAYNLLYVEKTYLALQSQSDLVRCGEGYRACASHSCSTSDADVYQHHSKMRQEKYRLEEE